MACSWSKEAAALIPSAYDGMLKQALQQAIILGEPAVSDEEMAERRAARGAARARVASAIAAVADPALRAVLDLHSCDGTECRGCDPGSYAESGAWWPCATVRALADHVDGLEESDLNLL